MLIDVKLNIFLNCSIEFTQNQKTNNPLITIFDRFVRFLDSMVGNKKTMKSVKVQDITKEVGLEKQSNENKSNLVPDEGPFVPAVINHSSDDTQMFVFLLVRTSSDFIRKRYVTTAIGRGDARVYEADLIIETRSKLESLKENADDMFSQVYYGE